MQKRVCYHRLRELVVRVKCMRVNNEDFTPFLLTYLAYLGNVPYSFIVLFDRKRVIASPIRKYWKEPKTEKKINGAKKDSERKLFPIKSNKLFLIGGKSKLIGKSITIKINQKNSICAS